MGSTTQIANNTWLKDNFPGYSIPDNELCPTRDTIVNNYGLVVYTGYTGNQLVVQNDISIPI